MSDRISSFVACLFCLSVNCEICQNIKQIRTLLLFGKGSDYVSLALHPNFDTIHEIEKMHPQRVQTGAFWRRWLYLGAYGCIGRTRVH